MKLSATWLLLAAGVPLAPPALAQDVEIGIVAPISGPAATYGKDLMNGVNLAVEEINAAGGVGGRKLVAIVGDDRASPKDAANVAQTFVSDPKVLAIIGGVTSTATFGAAPVAQKGKLPFVMTLASHPDLTKEGNYIFRNSVTQEQEGPALARMVLTCLAPKTVAIMYLNNDWGLSMTAEFKKALDPAKVKVVAEESYDPGENIDYSAKLAKIRAANPDVVWFGSQYNDLALILKQAQRVNLAGKPFVASTAANSPGLIEVAGAAANNLYLHAPFSTASPDPNVKAFVQKFEARYKLTPGTVAAQTYEAVHIVAREIAGGAQTREALQKALASMKPYAGLGGTISFDPQTREAKGKAFTPLVVKDRAFALWDDCQAKLAP
jgi:branched-chain amino acid transport system substrate-binding protein